MKLTRNGAIEISAYALNAVQCSAMLAAVCNAPPSAETDVHRHAHAAGGTVESHVVSQRTEQTSGRRHLLGPMRCYSATGAAYTFAPRSIRADPLGPMYVESEAPVAMLRMADSSASCSLRADAGATRSTVC